MNRQIEELKGKLNKRDSELKTYQQKLEVYQTALKDSKQIIRDYEDLVANISHTICPPPTTITSCTSDIYDLAKSRFGFENPLVDRNLYNQFQVKTAVAVNSGLYFSLSFFFFFFSDFVEQHKFAVIQDDLFPFPDNDILVRYFQTNLSPYLNEFRFEMISFFCEITQFEKKKTKQTVTSSIICTTPSTTLCCTHTSGSYLSIEEEVLAPHKNQIFFFLFSKDGCNQNGSSKSAAVSLLRLSKRQSLETPTKRSTRASNRIAQIK
jgi:hypothetical protein